MNERPSRLGRGLAALIGDMATLDATRVAEAGGGKRLPVEFIIANRANPRRDFDPDQLEELTHSIREKGVVQPLLVRPTEDPNIFEIIAGELQALKRRTQRLVGPEAQLLFERRLP